MNNDLLRRINAALYDDADPYQALRDCRAEIERLNTVLEVTDENHGRTTVLAHKALKDLDKAQAEIERLSKPYVPMTDDDWCEAIDGETRLFHGANIGFCKIVERIVIKRAGLEIKHD